MDTPTYITLNELIGNRPTGLDPLQAYVAPHVQTIAVFWWFVWIATAAILIVLLVKEYLAHRHDKR